MAQKNIFAGKRAASILNLAVAVLLVVIAIAYAVCTTAASNFNSTVVLVIVLAAVCAAVFALVENKFADLGNLAAVGLIAYAIAQFLINSINAFVDAFSGLSMFGSSGGITYIIVIVALMLVAMVVEIITCFMKR